MAPPDFPTTLPRPRPLEWWIDRPQIINIFKECTPKILVYADGGDFTATGDFGLKSFVDTLKATTIHGMTPIIETAHIGADPDADHPSFTFSDASFSIRKYDVLFLFAFSSGSAKAESDGEIQAIIKFMEAGGGVFGTGDHSTLGRRLCGNIPRIKSMRYWDTPDVPSASGTDRLTTNHPGSNNQYEFNDQADDVPQRLYPAYYPDPDDPTNNSLSKPHYLLQHPTKQIIEVLPDHPHEGECVVPSNLGDTFVLDGETRDEYPGGVTPELVAMSMSAGGGFSSKQPVIPRAFGAVGAYDGHEADVGRVTVDATWHHFVNVNVVPTFATNTDAYDRVQTYWRNHAEWLMPKKVRRCLRWPLIVTMLDRFPLRENLPDLRELAEKDVRKVAEIGASARETAARAFSPAALAEFESDLLNLSQDKLTQKLDITAKMGAQQEFGRRLLPRRFLRNVALGAGVVAIDRVVCDATDPAKAIEKAGGMDGLEKLATEEVGKALRATAALLLEGLTEVEGFCRSL